MKILIVDDNATNLALLKADLESEGNEVFQAGDGLEALTILERENIDAVISDILMPRMDGYRLCHKVRSSSRLHEMPFIFYTSTYTSASDEKFSLELGADKLVRKPASARALMRAVRGIHRASQTRTEPYASPQELSLMGEYSERLVEKLEQRNTELLLQTTALETAANGVVITNRDGAILWVNPAFTTLTGYTLQEIAGKTPRVLKSGRHDLLFYRNLWDTLLSGETWRGKFTNRRKDGSQYYSEQTITPVRSDGGSITHFIGIMNDITARRQTEEELRRVNEELHQLIEHSPAVIYKLIIDGTKMTPVMVSRTIERLLGFTAEEASTFEWWRDGLHPEDRERVLKTISRELQKSGYSIEYRMRHKDGTYRWIEDSNHVIEGEPGEPKETVGIWMDITTRRQMEEALRTSEERFRQIAENVADLIAVLDLDGNRLYNSPSYRTLLGDPVLLRGTNSFEEIHPDDRDRIKESFRATVTTGIGQRAEYRFLLKDGSIRHVESQGSVIRGENGAISNVLVVSRDVTEKKRLEQQFLRAQRMESIGTLAGGIAHDLNNVLAPILMAVEILKKQATDEKSKHTLDILEASAKRGSSMVRQVLTFARGAEGERGVLQPKHLIDEVVKIARETFPKSIQVRMALEKDLWTILGDATQLHQVLLNLCVNARDAMPNGGDLTISGENVELDENFARMNIEAAPGRYVILGVTDNGTGIPRGIIEKIFDPFFTTKEIGKGTGLGLSTARSIIKGHGGWINAYSETGRGSRFRLYLPAQSGPELEKQEIQNADLLGGHGELILIADDEASIRDICKETLETYGYRVATVNDGAEAVAYFALNKNDVALVLTDMMMPFMDGPATMRALKKLDPGVKIIATSGFMEEEHNTVPLGLQVQAFLAKPYTAEKLLKVLHEVIAPPAG